jgi:carboxylate-amine ligase
MTDTKLWPHGNREIYSAYDRIFDCRGHGWSNLQSVHINFPFFDDEEFGRLHAAIRLCLPLLPAIAASSPIADGKLTQCVDTRLNVYRKNQLRVPSITGSVVPEACFDRKSYDQMIFQPMFKDIAPFDPEGLLQHEWLNSRGAIARWDRHAIEIRVIDIQESLLSDFAVIRACTSLVRALVEERWISYEDQRRISTESLRDVMFRYLDASIDERIKDQTFLDLFGYQHSRSPTYLELWEYLASELTSWEYPIKDSIREFQHILENGNLSTRIVNSVRKIGIADCYQELHRCLIEDRQFQGA